MNDFQSATSLGMTSLGVGFGYLLSNDELNANLTAFELEKRNKKQTKPVPVDIYNPIVIPEEPKRVVAPKKQCECSCHKTST